MRLTDLAAADHSTGEDAQPGAFGQAVREAHIGAAIDDETDPCAHATGTPPGACSISDDWNPRASLVRNTVSKTRSRPAR